MIAFSNYILENYCHTSGLSTKAEKQYRDAMMRILAKTAATITTVQ